MIGIFRFKPFVLSAVAAVLLLAGSRAPSAAGQYYAIWDGHSAILDWDDNGAVNTLTVTAKDDNGVASTYDVSGLYFLGAGISGVTGDASLTSIGSIVTGNFVGEDGQVQDYDYNYWLDLTPDIAGGASGTVTFQGVVDSQDGHPFAVKFGDNIVVVDAPPPPIPEPAFVQGAVLLGLGGLGLLIRRRKA